MAKRYLTKEDVIVLLRREIERMGSQRALARELDVSVQYISGILSGRNEPGPRVADRLGLREVGKVWERAAGRPRKGQT